MIDPDETIEEMELAKGFNETFGVEIEWEEDENLSCGIETPEACDSCQ